LCVQRRRKRRRKVLFTERRRRRLANAMREVDQGLCRKRDKAENACA